MKKSECEFDERFESMKRTADKEQAVRDARSTRPEQPFKDGETIRAPCPDGNGSLLGKFTARVKSCFQYGGRWSVTVIWQSGPKEGEQITLGPQFLDEADAITRLGDLMRLAANDDG